MPRLVINPGTIQATELQFKPGSNIFGRAPGSDFKLDDPSVSGTHCHIIVADGAATITDLGSTNGTFVDQSPVREAVLQLGSQDRPGIMFSLIAVVFCLLGILFGKLATVAATHFFSLSIFRDLIGIFAGLWPAWWMSGGDA